MLSFKKPFSIEMIGGGFLFTFIENDPAIYMDMSKFSPYKYSKEKVDKYFDEQQIESRIVFIIMLKDKPVGEVSVF